MKKVMLIAAVLVAFGTTACKKEYTCVCKADDLSYTYNLGKIKKSDAKDACQAAGNSWIAIGGTCTEEKA